MDAATVSRALDRLRAVLEPDGYGLHVAEASPALVHVRVTAGPDACADCLVPKGVFAGIVRDALPAEVARIVVDYPPDAPC